MEAFLKTLSDVVITSGHLTQRKIRDYVTLAVHKHVQKLTLDLYEKADPGITRTLLQVFAAPVNLREFSVIRLDNLNACIAGLPNLLRLYTALEKLYLSGSRTEKPWTNVIEMLPTLSCFTQLDLVYINLSDSDALMLCNILPRCRTLQNLKLFEIKLSKETLVALEQALTQCVSLRELNLERTYYLHAIPQSRAIVSIPTAPNLHTLTLGDTSWWVADIRTIRETMHTWSLKCQCAMEFGYRWSGGQAYPIEQDVIDYLARKRTEASALALMVLSRRCLTSSNRPPAEVWDLIHAYF